MASFINSVVNAVRGNRDRVAALERAVAKLTKQAEASPIATGFDGGISMMSALANQQDIVVAVIIDPPVEINGHLCNARIMRTDNVDGSWGNPDLGRPCEVVDSMGGVFFEGAVVTAFLADIGTAYDTPGGYGVYRAITGEHLGFPIFIGGTPTGEKRDRYPWYTFHPRAGNLGRLTHESPGMTHALCVGSYTWDPLIAFRNEPVFHTGPDTDMPIFMRISTAALVGCWFNGTSDPVCLPECPDP